MKRPLGAECAGTSADSRDPSSVILDPLAASVVIGCSERKAAKLMSTQAIPARKVGRAWRCTLSAVIYYMTSGEETK